MPGRNQAGKPPVPAAWLRRAAQATNCAAALDLSVVHFQTLIFHKSVQAVLVLTCTNGTMSKGTSARTRRSARAEENELLWLQNLGGPCQTDGRGKQKFPNLGKTPSFL